MPKPEGGIKRNTGWEGVHEVHRVRWKADRGPRQHRVLIGHVEVCPPTSSLPI